MKSPKIYHDTGLAGFSRNHRREATFPRSSPGGCTKTSSSRIPERRIIISTDVLECTLRDQPRNEVDLIPYKVKQAFSRLNKIRGHVHIAQSFLQGIAAVSSWSPGAGAAKAARYFTTATSEPPSESEVHPFKHAGVEKPFVNNRS